MPKAEVGPVQRPGGFPSFCIYGPSGSGKTPQIERFALQLFKESGGTVKDDQLVGGLRTRLYTKDRGGFDSILPSIELGLIELVDLRAHKETVWVAFPKAIQGRMPLEPGSSKWSRKIKDTDANGNRIGCWAYEGLTEFGQALKDDMGDRSAAGENVGGGTIDARVRASDDEGEDFSYAGHTRAHYMMGQDQMDRLISMSMRLPGYLIWTALDMRANDTSSRQVVGPDVGVGSKMTAKIPQKFTYTFRTVNMAEKGKGKGDADKAIYRLYMLTHQDPNVLGLTGVCNARYPVDAPIDLKVTFVEPADIAKAYVIVKRARNSAKQALLESLSS